MEENKETCQSKEHGCGCEKGADCNCKKWMPHNWFKPCLLKATFITVFYLIIVIAIVMLYVLFRMAYAFNALWTWPVWLNVLQILAVSFIAMTVCMTYVFIIKALKKIKHELHK